MPQLREPLDGLPGANRKLPHVSDNGQGVNQSTMREPLEGVKPKPLPGQTRAGFEKFPAPYFGGKSGAAAVIWQALGDVEHYVEPFCGSAAVLLARPHSHTRTYYSETLNDIDGFIVNAFRAMAAAPEAVAEFAAWPVFEADLHARHQALIRWRHEGQLERLMGDPDWYDARIAGWWLWGQSCWIGSGWCSGRGPWVSVDGVLMDRRKVNAAAKDAPGAGRQLPHISDDGQGVNMPKLREPLDGLPGANRKLPHISDNGSGVNAPQLREPLEYTHATAPPAYELGRLSTEPLRAWMRRLQDRLRWVRALNGDWKRAATNGAMNTLSVARMGQTGHCGVFLDPPYADTAGRAADVYAHDSLTVAHEVREWCLAHTDTPWLRVVLAGFEGEHNDPETGEDMLVRAGWRCVSWYGGGYLAGGMGNTGKAADGGTTSQMHRDRLWLSPQCLPVDAETRGAAQADKAPAAVAGDEQLIFPVLLGGSV